MKTVSSTFFLFSFLLLQSAIAQTDAFPLALGNRWIYEDEDGNLLTRHITAVQTINGTDFFTRVDSVFSGSDLVSVDTIVLFDRPANTNDVMAIAKELPVDTMKIRQHQYFNNPNGGSQEWSELYITENSPFDSVRVEAGYAFIGTDEVPQIGLSGVFSFGLGIYRYQQDTIVAYSDEYPGDNYPSSGYTIFSYYPGDLVIHYHQATFNLIAYQLQTATSTASWTLPKELKVYPNPAVNELFLDASEVPLEIEVLGIMDSFGRQVNSNTFPRPGLSSTQKFDISDFPTGMYFLLVKIDNQMGALPFSKQ